MPTAEASGSTAAQESSSLAPGDGRIKARYRLDDRNDEADAVERSRLLFDLDTDPQP